MLTAFGSRKFTVINKHMYSSSRHLVAFEVVHMILVCVALAEGYSGVFALTASLYNGGALEDLASLQISIVAVNVRSPSLLLS